MVRIRDTGGRPALLWTRQLLISVTSSLGAAVVLGGLHMEATSPVPVAPDLTSGGKFAARLDLPDDLPTLPSLPTLPVLAIVQAALPPVAALPREASPSHMRPVVRVRRPFRSEPRRAVPIPDTTVVPPRRIEAIATESATRPVVDTEGFVTQAWSAAEGMVHRTIGIGDAMAAKLWPARFFE